MSDVIGSVRQIIQDLAAPDLKALQSKLDSQSKQLEMTTTQQSAAQHDATMKVLEAFRAEMRSEFAALKALNQVEVMRQVSPFSERIAIVERR
ncbi:MAG: hypothetical protein ACYDC6_04215 [Acidobacteriaceae bacterium]